MSSSSEPFTLKGTKSSQPSTKMPKLIYGTAWKKEKTGDLVYQALKSGFRAIDTAAQPRHYQEHLVGDGIRRAISEGVVARKDLFIQTKFTSVNGQDPTNLPYDASSPLPDQVHASIASSLANLTIPGEDAYLDCVVLHSPYRDPADTMAVWRTLESYVPHKIHHLGISNVDTARLEALFLSSEIKPAVVQNRFYPATKWDVELRDICKQHGAVYQAFSATTANPRFVADEAVVGLVVEGAGVSPVLAMYSLVLGLGNVAVLDGTSDLGHMEEDLAGIKKVRRWALDNQVVWDAALLTLRTCIGEVY